MHLSSPFSHDQGLLNEFTVFDDHLLMSYWLRALESGRDTSSFLLRSCRKRLRVADGACAKSIPLENDVSSDILFPGNSLMSRWVSSETGCTRAVLFILNILFSLVSSFLIGSDDKISARVRSQLSLNEAIIERSSYRSCHKEIDVLRDMRKWLATEILNTIRLDKINIKVYCLVASYNTSPCV